MHGLLVRLRVRDFGAWRSAFDEQELVRRAYGCQDDRVFRSIDEQDDVMVLLEWDDVNRAWMFAQSDVLWTSLAWASAGISSGPTVWLIEEDQRLRER